MTEDELVEQLGFRVVKRVGRNGWSIETVRPDGTAASIRPCLLPEVWTLWQALLLAYAKTDAA